MRVAKDEENGLDTAKKTIISPAYCTIVHSSYGSWACVFFHLYHTHSAISAFPFSCMLVCSLSIPPSQPLLQQQSLSALFILLVVPLFSLSYCTFHSFSFSLAQLKCLVTLQEFAGANLCLFSLGRSTVGGGFCLCYCPVLFNNYSLNFNAAMTPSQNV